jgi:hypothetical protein
MTAGAEDRILLDTGAPDQEATVTGEMGVCGWYTTPVTVEIESTDALSDVASIEWYLDSSDWRTYEGPVVIEGDGSHRVAFRSFDTLGNSGEEDTVSFQIDATPPQDVSWSLAGGVTHVNVPTILLELAAIDPTSGLDSMRFRVDDEDWGEWINYQDDHYITLPDEEGEHTLMFSVRDVAGNVAVADDAITVVLDRAPPAVVETRPADEQERVPVDTVITVQVTEELDVSTLTDLNFLVQDAHGIPLPGAFGFDAAELTITFTPGEDLFHDTVYSVMMRGGISDLAGNQLNGGKGQMWTFITDGLPPEPLEWVTAEPTDYTIVVSWSEVPRTYSGDLTGYNVYRMADDGDPDSTFGLLTTSTGTSFEDDNVLRGIQYHYYVTAVTTYGEGEAGDVASAIIVPELGEPEEPLDGPDEPEPRDEEPLVHNMDPEPWSLGPSIIALLVVISIVVVVAAVLLVLRKNEE